MLLGIGYFVIKWLPATGTPDALRPLAARELAQRLGLTLVSGNPEQVLDRHRMFVTPDLQLRMTGTRDGRPVELSQARGTTCLTMFVRSRESFQLVHRRPGSDVRHVNEPLVTSGVSEIDGQLAIRARSHALVSLLVDELRALAPLVAIQVSASDGRLTLHDGDNCAVAAHGATVLPIFDRIAACFETSPALEDEKTVTTALFAIDGSGNDDALPIDDEPGHPLGPVTDVLQAPLRNSLACWGWCAMVACGAAYRFLHAPDPKGLATLGVVMGLLALASLYVVMRWRRVVVIRRLGFEDQRVFRSEAIAFSRVRSPALVRSWADGRESGVRFELDGRTRTVTGVRPLERLFAAMRTARGS